MRGAWVDSRQPKGEKYLLLYKPDARHAWDTSDAVVLDGTVAAQYIDNGFVVSVEAGKKILSGGAASIRAAAPPEMLERERVLPPQAPRAPPREGARPARTRAVAGATAAAAARRGRANEPDTDTENIPGGSHGP